MQQRSVIVMINPDGDAKRTGRTFKDTFERSITLQCATAIKERLEQETTHIKIVLTREPGEMMNQLQNAQFANRMQVDLYISLHMFQTLEAQSAVDLYTFSYGNTFLTKQNVQWIPYDKAHLASYSTSKTYAQESKTILEQALRTHRYSVQNPVALPFAPLLGITRPAFAIECGMRSSENWQHISTALSACIAQIFASRE